MKSLSSVIEGSEAFKTDNYYGMMKFVKIWEEYKKLKSSNPRGLRRPCVLNISIFQASA